MAKKGEDNITHKTEELENEESSLSIGDDEFETGSVRVEPFVNSQVENMGLEKYEMVLVDGATHKEYVTCLEPTKGVKRYITGLDPFAPEINKLDEKKKAAVTKEIRRKVAFLEETLKGNIIKKELPDDEFWKNVKTLNRDNDSFWANIFIEVGNNGLVLNPKDPEDFIKLSCIEAGGFTAIARSYEEAKSSGGKYKFYLNRQRVTESFKVNVQLEKNRAIAKLTTLHDTEPKKLWYIAKILDEGSFRYRLKTPPELVYKNMDLYLNGQRSVNKVNQAVSNFKALVNLSVADLKIRAIVNNAKRYSYLVLKPDGHYYYSTTNQLIGRTMEDCIEFLKNDLNADILIRLTEEVEALWK